MSDAPLLPCPFCGGEASTFEDYGHTSAWSVGCFNGACRAEPHVWEETKAEAIAAWNTRAIPAVQPTVKPLVWTQRDDHFCAAESVIGMYYITEYAGLSDPIKLECPGQISARWFSSIEAAKAAAQADYEARILSTLDMQPTVKPDVAALEKILSERGAVFDAMVDAAEDAAGKGVSFNVVIGRALRAALARVNEVM